MQNASVKFSARLRLLFPERELRQRSKQESIL